MTDLTAIDILLEPDRQALERVGAVNALLRAEYSAGFALDAFGKRLLLQIDDLAAGNFQLAVGGHPDLGVGKRNRAELGLELFGIVAADHVAAGQLQHAVGLQVAAFGTGSALSSLGVGVIRNRFGLLRTTRLGLVLLGFGLIGYAAAPHEALVLSSLFVAGIGFLLGVTTTNSNLQRRLDEDMRGRVMALWSMAFLGSRPLAGLIDGAVADLTSPRLGVLVAVAPLLFGWWALHRVARADRGDLAQASTG